MSADLGNRLAVAQQDNDLPLLFDRLDQLGKAPFGFVHINSDHHLPYTLNGRFSQIFTEPLRGSEPKSSAWHATTG
jgi:hypothetical protein